MVINANYIMNKINSVVPLFKSSKTMLINSIGFVNYRILKLCYQKLMLEFNALPVDLFRLFKNSVKSDNVVPKV